MASATDTISETTSTADYPDGPITCCLRCVSKEIRVLKHRTWTVSVIISWCSSVLSVIFFLVAFATIGWVRVNKMDEYPPAEDMVGLWQECVHATKCAYISGDITGAGFKTSQVFAVVCLLLIMIGCAVTIKYSFSARPKSNTGNAALCLRFVCFFLLLLLIPVFAMTWDQNHARYDKSIYDHKMEYSFVLVAVTFVLEAIGVFFTYCEVMVIQRKVAKPLLRQPKTVDYYDGITNEGFTEIPGPSGVYPGDMGLGHTKQQPERLEDQVRGRLDARSAYENFAFSEMQVHGSGVAGPLASSMFRSTDDIAKRFVGITLAEPQYTSPYVDGKRLPTVTGNDMPYVSSPETYSEQVQANQNRTLDNVNMKQSVSMQNMFNENLVLANTEGRMVTSVSMYDISNESANKPYVDMAHRQREKDDFSLQSWHPDGNSIPASLNMSSPYNAQGNMPGLPNHKQYDEIGSGESQPRSRTNRGPVQRRLEANRQANNYLMNSKNFKDISQQETNQFPQNEQNYNQNGGQYSQYDPPAERSRAYERQTAPNAQATKPSRHRKDQKSRGTHDKHHPDLNTSRMSHGQSNMSLHSVTSTATSIVAGCTETEI